MADEIHPGDSVVCYVKDFTIMSVYAGAYDQVVIFDVIGTYDGGYWIYIPQDMLIKGSKRIDDYNYKGYLLHRRYVDSEVIHITEHQVLRIYSRVDGARCCECEEFVDKAQPNQESGLFKCWSCRNYPQYKSRT